MSRGERVADCNPAGQYFLKPRLRLSLPLCHVAPVNPLHDGEDGPPIRLSPAVMLHDSRMRKRGDPRDLVDQQTNGSGVRPQMFAQVFDGYD